MSGRLQAPGRGAARRRPRHRVPCLRALLYRGATTAEIAREAGVTEPILYRHFASKQALYLACIETAWQRVRAAWDEAVANEPDPHALDAGDGRARSSSSRSSARRSRSSGCRR